MPVIVKSPVVPVREKIVVKENWKGRKRAYLNRQINPISELLVKIERVVLSGANRAYLRLDIKTAGR
jgi:hypothetical protein